jgi:purine-binding chemotaxis protein CheW
VPSTPVWVLGLINLRGSIVSVIDLRHLFDLPGRGLSDLNHVLVVHAADMDLGVLADEIAGTRIVFPSELRPPKPAFGGLWEEYITGVTDDGLTVLNPARLFADPALLVRHKPFKARHA